MCYFIKKCDFVSSTVCISLIYLDNLYSVKLTMGLWDLELKSDFPTPGVDLNHGNIISAFIELGEEAPFLDSEY